MKVGVYIDGFNLYYGGRAICGRGTPGWRWLDLRALSASLLPPSWTGAAIVRVVYCTARISAASNPSGAADQDVYLKALGATGSTDVIEQGYYVARVKKAPLATEDPKGRPILARAAWPVMVRDGTDAAVRDASFMVSYAYREEKGSDVNVAAHLLIDTLESNIDGAIVVSNDSDLGFPIRQARERIPIGTVNPSRHQTAGALKGARTDGVGRHWWRKLKAADFRVNQLPDPANSYSKPSGW